MSGHAIVHQSICKTLSFHSSISHLVGMMTLENVPWPGPLQISLGPSGCSTLYSWNEDASKFRYIQWTSGEKSELRSQLYNSMMTHESIVILIDKPINSHYGVAKSATLSPGIR